MSARTLIAALAVSTTALLGGCATSSFNGYSQEPAAQVSFAQNPYVHDGRISAEELKVALNLAKSCREQHTAQMAGLGHSMANGAIAYGPLGGLGVSLGSQAWQGADAWKYGQYGALASAGAGAAGGGIIGSTAITSATSDCTKVFIDQLKNGEADPKFDDLHLSELMKGLNVEAPVAGKSFSDRPPALDKSAPWPPK